MSDKKNLEHTLGVLKFISAALDQTAVQGPANAQLLIASKQWVEEFSASAKLQLKSLEVAPKAEAEPS